MKFEIRKLESWGGEEIVTLAFVVLTIPARDRHTEIQTDTLPSLLPVLALA